MPGVGGLDRRFSRLASQNAFWTESENIFSLQLRKPVSPSYDDGSKPQIFVFNDSTSENGQSPMQCCQ
jgi:hypothetical protein